MTSTLALVTWLGLAAQPQVVKHEPLLPGRDILAVTQASPSLAIATVADDDHVSVFAIAAGHAPALVAEVPSAEVIPGARGYAIFVADPVIETATPPPTSTAPADRGEQGDEGGEEGGAGVPLRRGELRVLRDRPLRLEVLAPVVSVAEGSPLAFDCAKSVCAWVGAEGALHVDSVTLPDVCVAGRDCVVLVSDDGSRVVVNGLVVDRRGGAASWIDDEFMRAPSLKALREREAARRHQRAVRARKIARADAGDDAGDNEDAVDDGDDSEGDNGCIAEPLRFSDTQHLVVNITTATTGEIGGPVCAREAAEISVDIVTGARRRLSPSDPWVALECGYENGGARLETVCTPAGATAQRPLGPPMPEAVVLSARALALFDAEPRRYIWTRGKAHRAVDVAGASVVQLSGAGVVVSVLDLNGLGRPPVAIVATLDDNWHIARLQRRRGALLDDWVMLHLEPVAAIPR